ncbi:hypothetical protein [Thermoleptolyngbya sp. C42_A2020_037]|uniref:hypothetical protein n=1 Tax=Thermoleptolyngbya sp. C42_A2020_037 TaxID=2747799 RepID=UPI0019E2A64F|nr:hypothetical protein [Thermoleptolyngbya sp. C42_A2020_037]MBF2083161.1 hypothetical protein [Thermoleptolyngbya sp. C42_A2020_037]
MPWTLPKIFPALTVLSALALPGLALQPGFAADPPSPQRSSALQRLGQMFSPEIQSTIGACLEQGKVDVAAGPTSSGAVRCGDGSTTSVPYAAYVATVSDVLTASSLVGFRAVLQSNSGVSPEMLRMFVNSPQGGIVLRQAVQTAITQSELLPATATASTDILTDAVLTRLLPSLQDPTTLDTLLGTPEQYSQVVREFCTAPGMSVEQAKSRLPLNELQLYAICIQESGVADEMLRLGGR